MGQQEIFTSSKDSEKAGFSNDSTQLTSYAEGDTTLIHEGDGMKRAIKSRHAQMIAIGGTIGTGLFVGSGQGLARAGPAFLFIGYCLTSLLVYGIVTAVVEVASYLPLPGCSMAYCANRYVSRSLGFALGWLYFYSFGILVAYEVTAAAIVIDYWPNSLHIGAWITIMLIVIVLLNFCPVGIYAEAEFWFASIKVVMIVGLLILSFILFWGGGPNQNGILGFHYWKNPGATKEMLVSGTGGRVTAFFWAWSFSGFSFFFGPELIVYTAGEMKHPRKNLPVSARRFFYRLVFFYVLGALAIGIITDSTSEALVSGTGNAKSSPWVVAIQTAGIDALPSIINAGILTSAWSSGNSFLYMSSRALYSLSVQGSAPRIFIRCNKMGVPYYAVAVSALFSLLAYMVLGDGAGVVFNYLINLTNTAGYTSWICCCIVYLRFRKAAEAQGIKPVYRSRFQPYAVWVCLVSFTFLLSINGFTLFYTGNWSTSGFLSSYLGIPIFLALYFGHRIYRKSDPWVIKSEDVDMRSGVAEVEAHAEMWENEAKETQITQKPWLRKLLAVLWG